MLIRAPRVQHSAARPALKDECNTKPECCHFTGTNEPWMGTDRQRNIERPSCTAFAYSLGRHLPVPVQQAVTVHDLLQSASPKYHACNFSLPSPPCRTGRTASPDCQLLSPISSRQRASKASKRLCIKSRPIRCRWIHVLCDVTEHDYFYHSRLSRILQ